MRGWFCTLAACCIVLAACGGGKPASDTPTAKDGQTSSAPSCDDPLPDGEVSFQGHVATEPVGYPYNLYITVSLDRIQARPGTAIYGVERFVPHSLLTVVLPAFATRPPVASGNCVLGSGSVHRYQCHPLCDLAGFVVDTLVKANPGTATPTPIEVQPTLPPEQEPLPNVWFIARVDDVASLDAGTDFGRRDVTVTINDVLATMSLESRLSWKSDEQLKVILADTAGWPAVKRGDLLEVAGGMQPIACGPTCDGAGFVPKYMRMIE